MTHFSFKWMNGKHVMKHVGGHLPFEDEVYSLLKHGQINQITVAVNNTLTPTTLPCGSVSQVEERDRHLYVFVPLMTWVSFITNALWFFHNKSTVKSGGLQKVLANILCKCWNKSHQVKSKTYCYFWWHKISLVDFIQNSHNLTPTVEPIEPFT